LQERCLTLWRWSTTTGGGNQLPIAAHHPFDFAQGRPFRRLLWGVCLATFGYYSLFNVACQLPVLFIGDMSEQL